MYGNFLFNFAFKKLQECTLQKNLSMAEEDVSAYEMRFKKRMLFTKFQDCTVIELSTSYIETAQYRFLPTL